jgi:hypothetical protein
VPIITVDEYINSRPDPRLVKQYKLGYAKFNQVPYISNAMDLMAKEDDKLQTK